MPRNFADASIRVKLIGAAALAMVCVVALLLVVVRARNVIVDATIEMNRAVTALDTLSDAKAEGRLIPTRLRELQLANDTGSLGRLLSALVLYANQTHALLETAGNLVDDEMRTTLTATAEDLSLLVAGASLLAELQREVLELRDRDLFVDGEMFERQLARVSRDLHLLPPDERDAADRLTARMQELAVELRLNASRALASNRGNQRPLAIHAITALRSITGRLAAMPPSQQRVALMAIAHNLGGYAERFDRLTDLVDSILRLDAETITPRRVSYESALDQVFQRQRANYAAAINRLEGMAQRSKTRLIVLSMTLIAMIVALVVFIHRSVGAPMLKITGTMLRLADGDRGAAIPFATRRDEIGDLARAATQFRDALTEVEASRSRVEKALEMEREAHEQRKRFVTIASHEFRTPLAIIDGAAQRLQQAATPEAIGERAARIRAAVARMIQLIDRTLYAARLENGRIALAITELDLLQLLRAAVRRQQEINRHFTIDLDAPAEGLRTLGDAQMLEQVFQNLLSNAVKYSGRSTRVRVAAAIESDCAVVRVTDFGIGIPSDELPQMFQRFFRASTATGIAGTGIGLNFVKDLVDMHGGTIAVESKLGVGSVFTVRLPLAVAQPSAIASTTARTAA